MGFVDFYIFYCFWNLGYIVGIYKDIQCRWVKSCSRCVKPYNSPALTPRAILTAARVGRYDHITPIYIPPYAVPPATLIPGSRVSGLTGSQGSRVTGHHGSQGHRVTGLTGSQGHWVIGSIARVFSMVRVSMVTMVLGHGSPWVTITRIIGSQGYHGHRVTHHPGLGSQGHRVTLTMVTGHGSPITREIESPITRVTGLPSPWFRVTYNQGLTMVGCCVWIPPAHHL